MYDNQPSTYVGLLSGELLHSLFVQDETQSAHNPKLNGCVLKRKVRLPNPHSELVGVHRCWNMWKIALFFHAYHSCYHNHIKKCEALTYHACVNTKTLLCGVWAPHFLSVNTPLRPDVSPSARQGNRHIITSL